MIEKKPKVLVVDDEQGIRDIIVDTLTPHGYEVISVSDGKSAIEATIQHHPTVAFLDIRMPGMDGVELLGHLKSIATDMQVVMITGYSKDESIGQALNLGAFACLMKPFNIRDIIEMVEIVQMAA